MVFSKIDSKSLNFISSALNFFEIPPTNVSISNASFREYLTLNLLTSKPFHFKIHATSSYIDLNKCYIFTEIQIKKQTTTGFVDLTNEAVGTIQMIGSTFIKNLKVSINGRETFDSNSLYAYKSYFDAELSLPASVKDTYLSAAGYYNNEANIVERFADGNFAQFMAKIDADIFNQELYLINNVEIDIEIKPNDNNFIIKTAAADVNTYKVEFISCKLYVKTVDLMDGFALDVAKKLDLNPACYPLRKTFLKSFFITQGRTELNTNLFTEQVPRRIVLRMVANDAYVGNKTKNPFYFEPFNVRDLTITANGHNYPCVPYDLDFRNNKYVRAFHDMNEALNFAYTYDRNGINYKMFKNGWCIFVFNLTNSLEDEPYFDLIKNGTTAISIKFSNPVPAGGISLIVMDEMDGLVMVDKNRTITSDMTI